MSERPKSATYLTKALIYRPKGYKGRTYTRGMIVIPKEVRMFLGLKHGDYVRVTIKKLSVK